MLPNGANKDTSNDINLTDWKRELIPFRDEVTKVKVIQQQIKHLIKRTICFQW